MEWLCTNLCQWYSSMIYLLGVHLILIGMEMSLTSFGHNYYGNTERISSEILCLISLNSWIYIAMETYAVVFDILSFTMVAIDRDATILVTASVWDQPNVFA